MMTQQQTCLTRSWACSYMTHSYEFSIHCQWEILKIYFKKSLVTRTFYFLIYLTLHWPFLINVRLCSRSIKRYVYSCHTGQAGLLNVFVHCGNVWDSGSVGKTLGCESRMHVFESDWNNIRFVEISTYSTNVEYCYFFAKLCCLVATI